MLRLYAYVGKKSWSIFIICMLSFWNTWSEYLLINNFVHKSLFYSYKIQKGKLFRGTWIYYWFETFFEFLKYESARKPEAYFHGIFCICDEWVKWYEERRQLEKLQLYAKRSSHRITSLAKAGDEARASERIRFREISWLSATNTYAYVCHGALKIYAIIHSPSGSSSGKKKLSDREHATRSNYLKVYHDNLHFDNCKDTI